MVARRSLTDLMDVLKSFRVSQRHSADAAAWRRIAESLVNGSVTRVRDAIFLGRGNVRELLDELGAQTRAGTDRLPFLRGPKVGPMWIRMLAHPGAAAISSIQVIPVAVDVQVRKVTEYLGMTQTQGMDLEQARPMIQAAWHANVREGGAFGPTPIGGTASALDPALWFYAKWGCTRCERAGRRLPISPSCHACQLGEHAHDGNEG
jgi:hypothetical protein